ncbi:hypothetical protein ACWEVP_47985 [Amycolatopsis sp. NPDC003865]
MPYLGDFLGRLISEITLARMHSDQEAIRAAELYARDPLLKHFPVPRFRLPTLTMRVPVAVSGSEPAGTDQPQRVDTQQLKPLFTAVVNDHLARNALTISQAARRRVDKVLDARIDALEAAPDAVPSPTELAADLSNAVTKELPDAPDATIGAFTAGLESSLRTTLNALRPTPPRINVLVTDAQLQEATHIVQMELSLTENAVEWVVVDELAPDSARLLPE